MKAVGVRELTDRINEILRMVEEEGETFEVTDHGEVIARLIPAYNSHMPLEQEEKTIWADIDLLSNEISRHIPEKVDAVDIINNVRQEL
jgi:antitoxin (DNA-binding transcriptional repressor) of toxin-antitoxin stability system